MNKTLSLSILVLGLVLLMGCVSNPPIHSVSNSDSMSDSTTGMMDHPEVNNPFTDCTHDSEAANEECFEELFMDCSVGTGMFWHTSDNAPLLFESKGLDSEGKCQVHVSVSSDAESAFAGQSAECAVEKSPAMGEHNAPFFDVYSIGPGRCEGPLVDAIRQSADEPDSTPADTNETMNETPAPAVKTFSFTISEGGVVGQKEFVVNAGDTVELTFTVDTHDVSFNGEQVLGPAQKGLPADEYVFNTGQILPGKSKTVTFVADHTFDFGVYWPGPSVLKGKGTIRVE